MAPPRDASVIAGEISTAKERQSKNDRAQRTLFLWSLFFPRRRDDRACASIVPRDRRPRHRRRRPSLFRLATLLAPKDDDDYKKREDTINKQTTNPCAGNKRTRLNDDDETRTCRLIDALVEMRANAEEALWAIVDCIVSRTLCVSFCSGVPAS